MTFAAASRADELLGSQLSRQRVTFTLVREVVNVSAQCAHFAIAYLLNLGKAKTVPSAISP